MKTSTFEIVRHLLGESFNTSNNRILLQENKNADFKRKESKRYKHYF